MINFETLLKRYGTDLNVEFDKHFKSEQHLITEDLIRYWLIHFLQTKDSSRNSLNTEIEVPYIKSRKLGIKTTAPLKLKETSAHGDNDSRLNLYYKDKIYTEAIELKFHRATAYSNPASTTDFAGLLRDFNRLSILDCNKKYSVYVFDENCKKTYDKYANFHFIQFGSSKIGGKFSYTEELDKYIKSTDKGFSEIIKGAYSPFEKGFTFADYKSSASRWLHKDFKFELEILHKHEISTGGKKFYLMIFKIS